LKKHKGFILNSQGELYHAIVGEILVPDWDNLWYKIPTQIFIKLIEPVKAKLNTNMRGK